MTIAKRSLLLLAAVLVLPCAHAQQQSQAQMQKQCQSEIDRAESRIAAARKKPEYRSEQGRQVLTKADRSLNQARRHQTRGESRNCVSAAKKATQTAR